VNTVAKSPPDEFERMKRETPARLDVGRAGPRYTTAAMLAFRADHARAVDAVWNELPADWAKAHGMVGLHSQAESREVYLLRPELGRRLASADITALKKVGRAKGKSPSILICVGDGLSCTAVQAHAPALVRALRRHLDKKYEIIGPIFIRNARVRIQDHIGEIVRPDVIVMLIGERPGLVTAESLSAYVIWRPRLDSQEPDRTVVSNIHPGGLRIAQAATKIARLVDETVAHRASGAALSVKLAP
jgi:ethanolamine ammonia-lyase small subunit